MQMELAFYSGERGFVEIGYLWEVWGRSEQLAIL